MAIVVLGLGSNLGDRLHNIKNAVELISQKFKIIKSSSVYETKSLLRDTQSDYYNIVLIIDTDEPCEEVLNSTQSIESVLGRVRSGKIYEARVIDIDIIDYDGLVYHSERLTLPHKEAMKRSFVIHPLAEVYPEYIEPVTKKRISDILDDIKDDLDIKRIM